jgi:hypothetical protein
MTAPSIPSFLIMALIGGGLLLLALGAFFAVSRLPLERRIRFARFLGHAFLVVVAGTIVLGLIANSFR